MADVSGLARAQARIEYLQNATGGRVVLVGVAHLSETSPVVVRRVIREEHPAAVAIELCHERCRVMGLANSDALRDAGLEIVASYPQSSVFPGVLPMLLFTEIAMVSAVFSEIFSSSAYGAEQRAAIEEAVRGQARTLRLIDRPMTITMARCSQEQGLRDLWEQLPGAIACLNLPNDYMCSPVLVWRLVWHALRQDWAATADIMHAIITDAAAADPKHTSSASGRALTSWNACVADLMREGRLRPGQREGVQQLFLAAVAGAADDPELLEGLPRALTTERDVLLASALYNAPESSVVAVVGSAHVDGIMSHWGSTHTHTHELEAPPPWHTARAVALPVVAAVTGTYGMYRLTRRAPRVAAIAWAGLALSGAAVYAAAAAATSVHTRLRSALQR